MEEKGQTGSMNPPISGMLKVPKASLAGSTPTPTTSSIKGLFRRSPSPTPRAKDLWPQAAEATASIVASSLGISKNSKNSTPNQLSGSATGE